MSGFPDDFRYDGLNLVLEQAFHRYFGPLMHCFMEKERKKSKVRIFGVKLNDLFRLGTIIAGCVGVSMYLDSRFDNVEQTMNRKFDQVDRRFAGIESRLDKIKIDVNKTGDLLDAYLTWRFIYVHDPDRKDLVPRYDPARRAIEFVDKKSAGK
jgi:hypothetical protein